MNTNPITITRTQADILLQFMAEAAVAAAEDERFGEIWRIEQFKERGEALMRDFNEEGRISELLTDCED